MVNCIGRDMKWNLGCGQNVIFLMIEGWNRTLRIRFYSRSSSEMAQKGA